MSATFPMGQYVTLEPGDSVSQKTSPNQLFSPASGTFPNTPASISTLNTDMTSVHGSDNVQSPFHFKPTAYQPGPAQLKQTDVGRRRGHKYKHSSVSHHIFLEPIPRAPLQLPASLPIPTFKEYRSSMCKEQKLRLAWCFCHLVAAGLVQWSAHESLALTSLSRLMFYDVLGAFLCVAVDVGANFEVWKRSSIRHPFGFERLEVIAGLGMSVGLLFMGLDLVSHGLVHVLGNKGGHHADARAHLSPGSIDLAALAGILSTLVSAAVLRNHARMGRVMRLGAMASLPWVPSNPSHLLTLSCSVFLLLFPLLSIQTYGWLDQILSFSIALAMVVLGWVQGWCLGKMLLMSYGGPGVSGVLYDIETDPAVTGVEEAKFWQAHYHLCQANLKLRVRHGEETGRLRDRITSAVRNRLGGGYGNGGQRWEVSTQMMWERD